jgi:hypothetical protein
MTQKPTAAPTRNMTALIPIRVSPARHRFVDLAAAKSNNRPE